MANGKNSFYIDKERLREVILRAYHASQQGKGIFQDSQVFLPQWALPEGLEYRPQRVQVRFPKQAANYLLPMAFMERRRQTKVNIAYGVRTWNDQTTRWLFDSSEVVKRSPEEVKTAVRENLRYTLNDFPSSFIRNNRILYEKYGGDARKLVEGRTFKEAGKLLREFHGIDGIADLFMRYLDDRDIAKLQDPEEIRLKIDIHKARIPLNTNAVVTENGRVRIDQLAREIKEIYHQIGLEEGLNIAIMDSAIWRIGENGCIKRNYSHCLAACPLEDICESCIGDDRRKGDLVAYENGKRVELRKGTSQKYFNLGNLPYRFKSNSLLGKVSLEEPAQILEEPYQSPQLHLDLETPESSE